MKTKEQLEAEVAPLQAALGRRYAIAQDAPQKRGQGAGTA